MEQVQVKIKGQAITARYGTLNTGDILRTDAEFARHLVEDCAVAEYVTAKQTEVVVSSSADNGTEPTMAPAAPQDKAIVPAQNKSTRKRG
jgi:hypothetical protein